MATSYYGTTDRTRGALNVDVGVTSTAITITASSALQAQTYYLSGYRLNTTINGSVVATNAAYVPDLYSSFTTFLTTSSVARTFTRGKSAYTVSVGSSYTGETVDGWLAGGKSGSTSMNVSIPALASYSVTYDANGGTGAPATQTKWFNETLTLSSATPTRPLYNFLGWGTSAEDTTVDYAPGASYTANASLTLYAIWELAYTKPTISNVVVFRSDASGNTLDDGTYANVSFDWSTFSADYPIDQITISYKDVSDSVWTTAITLNPTGTSGAVSNQIINGNFDPDSAYDIRITAQDTKDESSYFDILSAAFFTMDIDDTGKAVGIGVPAPDPTGHGNGLLEIGMDVDFDGGLSFQGSSLLDYIFPVGTIVARYDKVSPASLYGGSWVMLESTFLWGISATDTIGSTGGESTHILTVGEIPSHTHSITYTTTDGHYGGSSNEVRHNGEYTAYTGYAGGGAAHNNMPPYTQVAFWRREA